MWWANAEIGNLSIEEDMNTVILPIEMRLHLVDDRTIGIMQLPPSKYTDNACLAKHEMSAINANAYLG
jgi:hypothetical protein